MNTYAVQKDYKIGYAQSWNVSVQQNLSRSVFVELSYLGTKGTDLDTETVPNRASLGSSPLTSQKVLPIGNAEQFIYDSSWGNSIYHAGQARLMRRFARNMSFNILYTFSKSIDDSSTFGGVGNVVAQNAFDLSAERGLSSFDRRHVLNLNYVLSTQPTPVGGSAIGRSADRRCWKAARRSRHVSWVIGRTLQARAWWAVGAPKLPACP